MLRFQRYEPDVHDIVTPFKCIFDSSEIAYLEELDIGQPSYVALDRRDEIQAFILTHPTPENVTDYEISYLGVMPRYRKKGYAERLVSMVLDATGTSGVWLQVMKSNTVACNLYKKLGFSPAEEFTTEDGEIGITWICGVEYECFECHKRLKPSETRWEKRACYFEMSTYGIQGNEQLKPLCKRCETRVES